MFTRVMPGEQAVRDASNALKRAARECEEVARRADAERGAFLRTPVGQARAAFEREDHVFQCALDVGSDTCELLNAIAREGWDLVSGSFGEVISAGDDVAIEGSTVGYYLFRRPRRPAEVA